VGIGEWRYICEHIKNSGRPNLRNEVSSPSEADQEASDELSSIEDLQF
jgi:hypothetical protein